MMYPWVNWSIITQSKETGHAGPSNSLGSDYPSPFQAQKHHPMKLRELADNLTRDGQAQAILVRQVEDHFELIAGERRWRAAQLVEGRPRSWLSAIVERSAGRRLLVAENIWRGPAPLEWIKRSRRWSTRS
jgi:ParB-like chromosome segregation protein Spo0J